MDILRTAGFYVSSVIIRVLVFVVDLSLKAISFFKRKKKSMYQQDKEYRESIFSKNE